MQKKNKGKIIGGCVALIFLCSMCSSIIDGDNSASTTSTADTNSVASLTISSGTSSVEEVGTDSDLETDTSTETLSIIDESDSDTATDSDVKVETKSTDTSYTDDSKESEKSVAIEYDTLQKIFLNTNKSLSESDLLAIIKENNLAYTTEEYQSVDNSNYICYKIAYDEKVVKQIRADDGDYLKFSFDVGTNMALLEASYFNQKHSVSVEYSEIQSDGTIKYTDYSHSPILREDGSKSGLVEMNYWEADSLEEALISALTIEQEIDTETASDTETDTVTSVSSQFEETTSSKQSVSSIVQTSRDYLFIINTDTLKYHDSSCHVGQKITDDHCLEYTVTAVSISDAEQFLQQQGYSPCGVCRN